MTSESVECPKCGYTDKTFKLSEIYIEALDSFKNRVPGRILPQLIIDQQHMEGPGILKAQALRSVIRSFGPPSSGAQVTRPVNPVQVMFGFTLLALFFLVQIYLTQRPLFPLVLGIVLLFYAGFFVFRKTIMGKYHRQIQQNIDLRATYEAAIGKWMGLYYCARDDVVFDPRQDETVPLQALEAYLLRDRITR